jgi:hypothetical protein
MFDGMTMEQTFIATYILILVLGIGLGLFCSKLYEIGEKKRREEENESN